VKIPRDLSGPDLVKALRALGYEHVRQDGSHLRLTTERGGQHHVTVPNQAGHADGHPQGRDRASQADRRGLGAAARAVITPAASSLAAQK
jgi:predicted RNA binding protein YcfA (HicA-like mRNA interferase family)